MKDIIQLLERKVNYKRLMITIETKDKRMPITAFILSFSLKQITAITVDKIRVQP